MGMEYAGLAAGVGPGWREIMTSDGQEWRPAQTRGPFSRGQSDPAASAPWGPLDGKGNKPKTRRQEGLSHKVVPVPVS